MKTLVRHGRSAICELRASCMPAERQAKNGCSRRRRPMAHDLGSSALDTSLARLSAALGSGRKPSSDPGRSGAALQGSCRRCPQVRSWMTYPLGLRALLTKGKLEQRCPICGRVEAAGFRCSLCHVDGTRRLVQAGGFCIGRGEDGEGESRTSERRVVRV